MEDNNIPEINRPVGVEGKPLMKKILPIALVLIMVGLGVFTGYMLSGKKEVKYSGSGIPKQQLVKGNEFGAKDASAFKDTASGVLEKNGTDGEGTHRLIRDGGPSQTVYVLSSVLDLDQFVGLKIQIWGETFKAQKAGWLMDVGKVKILD